MSANLIMSPVMGQELTVFAYEAVAISNASKGFTSATYSPATYGPASRAFITVETDQIRWTCDGSTVPTSTVGHLANDGDIVIIEGINNVKNFRCIRVNTDASIKVSYSRFRMGA